MPIRFACLECQRVYELPDAAAGRKAKCECGAMLDVPALAPKKPAPPRTLPKAAAAAREASKPKFDASVLAQLAENSRQSRQASDSDPDIAPVVEAPLPASASVPPLPPSPPQTPRRDEEPQPTGSPGVRYANLRHYCGLLQLLGALCLGVAGLIAAFMGLTAAASIPSMLQFGGDFTPLIAIVGAIVGVLVIGYVLFVLLNALAEFFHVVMDIEENTRR